MKYIKLFERLGTPQINDYVIIKSRLASINTDHQNFNDFVNNTIGKIIGYWLNEIIVQYEDVPENIIIWFTLDSHCKEFNDKGMYVRSFLKDEVIDFSSDREKLETKLAIKKFNL